MAPRSDLAHSFRVPAEARRHAAERAASERHDPARPRFRLVVTKGRLGAELEAPFALGPVWVHDLSLSLPDLKFPVELSGGVEAFRNRRGQLEELTLALEHEPIARWLGPQLRGLIGPTTPHCVAAPIEDGWLLGIAAGRAALCFELLVAPLDGDVRLLPTAARGLGLAAPPQQLAARALELLARPLGKRVGGALVIEHAARAISRHVLPLCGMRAARASGLRFGALELELERALLHGSRQDPPPAPSERVLGAVELCTLVATAEEALLAGDLDEARRRYLGAWERAPRHPEIARRVAEIDACAGGRAEAALGLLGELGSPLDSGVLGARLLAQLGDTEGAVVGYRRSAELEPFGYLAALGWLEVADASPDRAAQSEALDCALGRSPLLEAVRWRRFQHRVSAGELRGAREDAAHLEAGASGSLDRHAVVRRAAEIWLAQGVLDEAAAAFEKALRYLPDSVDAVAGLARSLGAVGKRRRALDLLGRALGLAERDSKAAHAVALDLARALVEVADDRPAAIAHVQAIAPFVPETFEARLLEARWRAELGDLGGASVALGRLGDAVERAVGLLCGSPPEPAGPYPALWGGEARWPTRGDARAAISALLVEGARIQDERRSDTHAAQRLLGLALRLTPRDRTVERYFRQLCRALEAAPVAEGAAARPRPAEAAPDDRAGWGPDDDGDERDSQPPLPPDREPPAIDGLPRGAAITLEAAIDLDEATGAAGSAESLAVDSADEQLISQLSDRLRADPTDTKTGRALAEVLERVGRDHELLALLSARMDDGPVALREELAPRRRAVLERLRERAAAAGKHDEAALYALMLEAGD